MLVDPMGQEVPFVCIFTVSPPVEDCELLVARRSARRAPSPELQRRQSMPDCCQVWHLFLHARRFVVEHQHLDRFTCVCP